MNEFRFGSKAAQLLLNYGCPPHVRIAGVTALDLAIAACQVPALLLGDMTRRRVESPKSPKTGLTTGNGVVGT